MTAARLTDDPVTLDAGTDQHTLERTRDMDPVDYISSKGERRSIAAMLTPHLANALAKLERAEPHREAEIHAMRQELAARDARKETAQ